jgi:hypothetical protein
MSNIERCTPDWALERYPEACRECPAVTNKAEVLQSRIHEEGLTVEEREVRVNAVFVDSSFIARHCMEAIATSQGWGHLREDRDCNISTEGL